MTADNRPVATDALKTLGTIITEAEARDAIHLAVEPVIAAHALRPGEHIGFVDTNRRVGVSKNPVGIVDPFLGEAVQEGQRFWLIVYPRRITSLRHVWEHPDFDKPVVVDAADQQKLIAIHAITEFAKELGSWFDEVMERADEYVENDEYWIEGGRFEGQGLPDKFWDHYQTLRGKRPTHDWGFFSCSC